MTILVGDCREVEDVVIVNYDDLELAVLAFDIVGFDPEPDWLVRLREALDQSRGDAS